MKEMTTSGTVTHMNRNRGMIAVEIDRRYTIIELLGDDVELGDVLSWDESNPLGGDRVYSQAQGRWLDVYFQNHEVPESQLRQQLLL